VVITNGLVSKYSAPNNTVQHIHFFALDTQEKTECEGRESIRLILSGIKGRLKIWLIIINNFVHDLFTGLWISTILVIYLLGRKVSFAQGIPVAPVKDIMRVFFWLGIFCILMIIITGIFRSINYKFTNSGTLGPVKKKILILKHIVLGLIFLGGTYLAYSWAFY